jgi:PAS domain S-box-containing protein
MRAPDQPDQIEKQPATATPLRVLLVEDNEDDASLLTRYFERAGYQPSVRRVETAEAMHQALNEPNAEWDVVLADFNLPSFSAPAALHLLKRLGQDVPFIVMSGAISEETAVDAMRAGAHDYVSKQNLTRLIPAIEREMREARARRLKLDAELALRTSQERFLRLVQAMPVGLMIAEPNGTVRYANTSVERLLGYSEQELRSGAVAFGSIFGAEGPAVLARLQSATAAEPRRPFEALCRTQANDHVPVLIALAPLAPEDSSEIAHAPEQIAIFFVDLTEQKRSEEVMRRTEKLAATGRLAASIAHEINNPLEAVTNCLFLLASSQLDARSREYLRIAQQELDRVTHITTQTLRFYRQSTRPVASDVNELLDSVIALYEPRLRSYSIAIERRYRNVPLVHAYEGEIRQVLANLVGNAIDAMHRDGGRLTLRSSSGRDPRTATPGIYVTVADTGCGIDAASRPRIFEAFFSTKGTTGTGLGLWVSQTIIEKHGGHVDIRSCTRQRPNGPGGTVFRIFFPLQSSNTAALHSNPLHGNL